MPHIASITGPIASDDLGFTLMHEHLFVLSHSMRQAFPEWVDRETLIAKAVLELRAAYQHGVRTIVDCTPLNLGRDVGLMREIAQRSEVHIIASGGLYWTEEPWLDRWEPDRMFAWLLKDLGDLEGLGVKAGVIKCGTDRLGVTPLNKKILQVTARLHHASGLPITTHTTVANHSALDQLDLFVAEGVHPERVVIGHCGDTDDMDLLQAILERGSFIGMDRFRPVHAFPTEKRVKVVAELCRGGYADRMILSHDTHVASDFGVYRRPSPDPDIITSVYCHIPGVVLPALRAAGVSDAHIHQMTVVNPRRILER